MPAVLHARSTTFLIASGVAPSKTGRSGLRSSGGVARVTSTISSVGTEIHLRAAGVFPRLWLTGSALGGGLSDAEPAPQGQMGLRLDLEDEPFRRAGGVHERDVSASVLEVAGSPGDSAAGSVIDGRSTPSWRSAELEQAGVRCASPTTPRRVSQGEALVVDPQRGIRQSSRRLRRDPEPAPTS